MALIALLGVLLVLDQLLLWCFLGMLPFWSLGPATLVLGLAAWQIGRGAPIDTVGWPTRRALAIVALLSAIVFLLGGEGRLFYAHTDWQVRAAVLRDLTLYPWPFVYDGGAVPMLLRAPLGMYLLPALVGKGLGYHAAEWALLAQNIGMLTLLIALGGWLFATTRSRVTVLAIFLGFSGMDIVGQLLAGQPWLLTSERWNVAIFSAHLSQAFAVPQHGLAGWTGAVLFLLWRVGKIPLGGFLAPIPLLALWSPLAVMGIAPFALFAGLDALWHKEVRAADVVWPVLTTIMALPGLLYLASGSAAVGGGGAAITASQYSIFELIEVGPYLIGLAFIGRHGRFGGAVLLVTAAMLLAAPFIQVGTSSDFVMRASIPALAVLAITVADTLGGQPSPDTRLWRRMMIAALLIGLATPTADIVRALVYPRAPQVVCSYFGVVPGGFETYVAPLSSANRVIAPVAPSHISPNDPARCWTGKWPNPLYHDFPERVAPEDRDERL